MRVLLILVSCSLFAVGCKKTAPGGPPLSATFDERQACGADEDCAVVELECCDHCNGGAVVGVHKDAAADVRKEFAPAAACGETVCTLMACAPATAICRQGRCGVALEGQESLPEIPRR